MLNGKLSYKRIWRLEGKGLEESRHTREWWLLWKNKFLYRRRSTGKTRQTKGDFIQRRGRTISRNTSGASGTRGSRDSAVVVSRGERICEEMDKFNDIDSGENASVLQKLRSIVAMNENLKKQEQEFRAHCKEEMARLQENIEKLKSQGSEDDNEEKERSELISKQYEADKAKLAKIRLLLARKNREISLLQRKIDEVPSRAELTQYQRRFLELYNHVAGTHKETKQFFTLYNTLDDTKLYLGKEVNLLNSIHDNFEQAMSSPSNKEQFLKQLESIVKGIVDNKDRIEKKKVAEKQKRDTLNQQYLEIVEQERLYYKTVKDFTEECHKNEVFLSKLKTLGLS
ncbi:coiled-coil domain-containing protein 93-like isoform X1 [Montipora capricornis]|uniref:coiled-coil domain-containing protein 93-like isoform X1 n=1 Tax=Montipora capricornis TaxID=246305 RepID=UPI0035F1BCF1